MAARDKLRKLNKMMRGALESIPQRHGSVFHLDPDEAVGQTFDYWAECVEADYRRQPRPEPPECLQAVANAVDRRAALAKVMQGYPHLPLDAEALVERGVFVARPMAPSYPPVELAN